jgi:hypothetical protein
LVALAPQNTNSIYNPFDFQGGQTMAPNQAASTDVQLPSKAAKEKQRKLDSASEFWGRSFSRGIFEDFLKTIAKILSGPMLTDIIKNHIKSPPIESLSEDEKHKISIERNIYDNFLDSFPSRFMSDFFGAVFIRLSKSGAFGQKMAKAPAEVQSQIVATFWTMIMRAMTSDHNSNGRISSTDDCAEAIEAREAALKGGGSRFIRILANAFNKYLKDPMDWIMAKTLGIHAGKPILDEEGNLMKNKKGKVLTENPTINWNQLWGVSSLSFIGSLFLLPRATAGFGFDDIFHTKGTLQALWRMFTSVSLSVLGRLQTTLWHNATKMGNEEGHGFDSCFRTAAVEKTMVPLVQYLADAIGAGLSKFVPVNGASLAMIIKLPIELIATFLTSGLAGLTSKGDMVPEHWRALGIKFLDPMVKWMESYIRPVYKFFLLLPYRMAGLFPGENLGKMGTLPPYSWFKNLFDPNLKQKAPREIPKEQREASQISWSEAIKIFTKVSFVDLWLKDIPRLFPAIRRSMEKISPLKEIMDKKLEEPELFIPKKIKTKLKKESQETLSTPKNPRTETELRKEEVEEKIGKVLAQENQLKEAA